jgi:hypothetical protein
MLFNGDNGQRQNTTAFCDRLVAQTALGSPMLRWLWDKAIAEWQ